MANRQIDLSVADLDEKDIAGTDAGTVTNDVRVVFVDGVDKDAAARSLRMIAAKIEAGGISIV